MVQTTRVPRARARHISVGSPAERRSASGSRWFRWPSGQCRCQISYPPRSTSAFENSRTSAPAASRLVASCQLYGFISRRVNPGWARTRSGRVSPNTLHRLLRREQWARRGPRDARFDHLQEFTERRAWAEMLANELTALRAQGGARLCVGEQSRHGAAESLHVVFEHVRTLRARLEPGRPAGGGDDGLRRRQRLERLDLEARAELHRVDHDGRLVVRLREVLLEPHDPHALRRPVLVREAAADVAVNPQLRAEAGGPDQRPRLANELLNAERVAVVLAADERDDVPPRRPAAGRGRPNHMRHAHDALAREHRLKLPLLVPLDRDHDVGLVELRRLLSGRALHPRPLLHRAVEPDAH